ncbi:MAG: uncharacterized protein PWQ18_141 [Clostridia bacterium]|nr:uncharacterized protein [Clostridia bacterium]
MLNPFAFQQIYQQNTGMLIYQDLTRDKTIATFLEICRQLGGPEVDSAALASACRHFFSLLAEYTELYREPLAGDPWQNYLLDRLIAAENTFTRKAEQGGRRKMGAGLEEAARQDLRALHALAGLAPVAYKAALDLLDHPPVAAANATTMGILPAPVCGSGLAAPGPAGRGASGNSEEKSAPGPAPSFAGNAARAGSARSSYVPPAPGENPGSNGTIPDWTRLRPLEPGRPLPPALARRELKTRLLATSDWGEEGLELLANYYHACGTSIFGSYWALRWEHGPAGGRLTGIADPDPITFANLIGYEAERQEVIRNTEKFLRGLPAVNILLYGARGTGKSSTVKALLPAYGNQGLRLIELPKRYLSDYQEIIKILAPRPQKFIIFIDDLSFEEDEVEYKELKGLL